jgi:hypothetical protein
VRICASSSFTGLHRSDTGRATRFHNERRGAGGLLCAMSYPPVRARSLNGCLVCAWVIVSGSAMPGVARVDFRGDQSRRSPWWAALSRPMLSEHAVVFAIGNSANTPASKLPVNSHRPPKTWPPDRAERAGTVGSAGCSSDVHDELCCPDPVPDRMDEMLTIQEVAARFDVSDTSVHGAITAGRLPATKPAAESGGSRSRMRGRASSLLLGPPSRRCTASSNRERESCAPPRRRRLPPTGRTRLRPRAEARYPEPRAG